MPRTSLEEVNCTWAGAAAVIGDQWVLLILRDALRGVRTFSAFQQSVGASKSVLSDRLARLVRHGVLHKNEVGVGINRHTYDLTDKGRALGDAMVVLGQWSNRWIFGEGDEPWLFVDARDGAPVASVVGLRADGATVPLHAIQVVPGPGADPDG